MKQSTGGAGDSSTEASVNALKKEYWRLLREQGVSGNFHDVPTEWRETDFSEAPDDVATQFYRRLFNHPYASFEQVGREGRSALLSRLATVRTRPQPFMGMVLSSVQHSLDGQSQAIRDMAAASGLAVPSIHCGVYPTGRYNAQAAPSKSGALILMDMGAYQLSYQIAKISVANSWSTPLIDKTQSAVALAELMNAYSFAENPLLARQLPHLDKDRARIADTLASLAQAFMLAHEYAHVLCGHLDSAGRHLLSPSTSAGGDIEVLSSSRQLEFEADEVALDILRPVLLASSSADFEQQAINFAGVMHFFRTAILVEIFREWAGRSWIVDTHPATEDRQAQVMDRLSELQATPLPSFMVSSSVSWVNDLIPTMGSLLKDVRDYAAAHSDGRMVLDETYLTQDQAQALGADIRDAATDPG